MFNHKSILFALALALPVTALNATKPTTTAGKIGASVVQTVHKHRKLISLPIANANLLTKKLDSMSDAIMVGIISGIKWALIEILLETTTTSLMNNFDIDPISN